MCLQIVVPFEMIVLAFHAAMGPVYPVLAKENRLPELQEAYSTAVRGMAILHLPMGIALAWNRNDILALIGHQFTNGATALLILAIGFATCMCFGTAAYLLLLSGRKSVETRNAAFAALLNIVLAIALVPRFGLTGAAFAVTFSFLLLNILRIWEVHYLMGLRTFRPYFVRIVGVSAGAGLGAFSALRLLGILQGRDAVSLALRFATMAVMHVVVLWTIGLNGHDKNVLRALLRSLTLRANVASL
jgi:O-antigen/teichoic acid export membrane protein